MGGPWSPGRGRGVTWIMQLSAHVADALAVSAWVTLVSHFWCWDRKRVSGKGHRLGARGCMHTHRAFGHHGVCVDSAIAELCWRAVLLFGLTCWLLC